MDIHHLPQDIFPAGSYKPEKIVFHAYAARMGSFNGKSILHTNTISLVMNGEKTMQFANKTLNIKNDEFHFISAGNCLASVNLSGKEIFKSILIFFDNAALTDFYLKYARHINKIKQKHTIKAEPFVNFKKDAVVLNFINSLDLLLQSNKAISVEMRQIKLEELLLHLLETHPVELLSFQVNERKDLDDLEIKKVVESNVTSNINIEELAFLCNVSLSTFKRRFEKIYCTSPNKWILQQRMELAKHLLQGHREKPSAVFHKVGYENHSSFSQSFKQYFGISPKDCQLQSMDV
jgi:AraC-like DNA-binding protein